MKRLTEMPEYTRLEEIELGEHTCGAFLNGISRIALQLRLKDHSHNVCSRAVILLVLVLIDISTEKIYPFLMLR